MAPLAIDNHNLLSLNGMGRPLCVECLACHHRGVLTPAQLRPGVNDHEMNSLVYLTRRMRCSECRSGAVKAFIPINEKEIEAFKAGLSVDVQKTG